MSDDTAWQAAEAAFHAFDAAPSFAGLEHLTYTQAYFEAGYLAASKGLRAALAAAEARAETAERERDEWHLAHDLSEHTDLHAQLSATWKERAESAEQERDEFHETFDLRHQADVRAITRWQEAHPERPHIWPDHADLVVWLLEQLGADEQRAEKAEQERDEAQAAERSERSLRLDFEELARRNSERALSWREKAKQAESALAAAEARAETAEQAHRDSVHRTMEALKERNAARADCAALRKVLDECAAWLETRPDYTEGDAATSSKARGILAADHPGADLLAELQSVRADCAALREALRPFAIYNRVTDDELDKLIEVTVTVNAVEIQYVRSVLAADHPGDDLLAAFTVIVENLEKAQLSSSHVKAMEYVGAALDAARKVVP